MSLKVTDYPFPHLVEDGLWDPELLARVLDEFPPISSPGWKRYSNSQERKFEGPPGLWGPATRELFSQIEKLGPELEQAFGIDGLVMETVGGGYHCIEPDGYLQMHTDFSISPRTRRYRRLNVLTYLNEGWNDGGHLELWDDSGPVVDIVPEFNRMVVFQTSATSWHGHPKPASRLRRSVAAYYFTDEPPPDFAGDQSTVWWAEK